MQARAARECLLALGVLASVLMMSRVGAQTSNASQVANQASAELQEVLVTATRRLEDIQDVPLSVTAFSAAQLEAKGVENFAGYGTSVPNLSFGLGAYDGSLAARGIALRGVQGANTTGFYIDDTPVLETLDPHILDVARIEVLRGPQGSLYGAESMGGTVRIITEQPSTAAFSAQVHASLSNTEHGSWNPLVEGVLNVPVVSDELAIRASGYYQFDSGWFTKWLGPENAPPASVQTQVGSMQYYGGQFAVRYEPLAGLAITPRLMYQRTDQNGARYATDSPDNLLQREVFDIREGGTDNWWLASLALTYVAPFGSFVSSTSVFDRRTFETEDDTDVFSYDLGLNPDESIPVPSTRALDVHRFAQEVRFASTFPGRLQLILGGFYSRTTEGRNYEITSTGLMEATGYPSDLLLSLLAQRQHTEYAAFGDISYSLLRNLTATIGLRAYHDTADWRQYTNGLFYGGAPSTYIAPTTSDSGVTPRYVLEYRVTPDLMTYASAAKGFREGGHNVAVPLGDPPAGCSQDLANLGLTASDIVAFKPDSLWSYDLGVKSSFLDRRLTVNAAAFLIEWTEIQQQVLLPMCGYFFTGNSGKAQADGFELELNGRLLPGLTLGIGVGYVDARITEQGLGSAQPIGSAVYQVPDLTLTGSLEYQWRVTPSWAGFGRIDSSYIGPSLSANNSELHPLHRPGYTDTDLRLGMRRDRYEVDAFVTNLTDQRANLADAVLIGAELPGQPRFLINQPRTVGIEARIRFQ